MFWPPTGVECLKPLITHPDMTTRPPLQNDSRRQARLKGGLGLGLISQACKGKVPIRSSLDPVGENPEPITEARVVAGFQPQSHMKKAGKETRTTMAAGSNCSTHTKTWKLTSASCHDIGPCPIELPRHCSMVPWLLLLGDHGGIRACV